MSVPPASIHATVVVIGERGVLIRGASGAGKSRLAQALISESHRRGAFARLVGDDRIRLAVTNRRAIARPHPAIAGLIEERGTGLLDMDHEAAARIACVIDLISPSVSAAIALRTPDSGESVDDSAGVELPRLALFIDLGPDEAARRILGFLERFPG